jgi:hypothetical protein
MLENEYPHAASEAEIRWLDSVLAGWTAPPPGAREKRTKLPPESRIDLIHYRTI